MVLENSVNELKLNFWKSIFDTINKSGEAPRDWCQRNSIDFEEFRPYACIFERQSYAFSASSSSASSSSSSSCMITEERKFEIKALEGTPFVEVPFTSQKTVDDITLAPWAGHAPSLVISSGGIHLSFYGELTEEKVRATLRGVMTSA